MIVGKLDFAATNEERSLLCKGCGFYFDVSLSPIRLKGENVETKAVSLAYRNMVDFVRKFLLSKFSLDCRARRCAALL